jgi:hypothetical protein
MTTPTQKYLVIVRGKGTPREQRITTTIPLCWSAGLQQWVTIPTKA